ncbi:hypothetical protein LCI18_002967 [Fusarium solani-melongenae]|uniref:Uncharacterized protein n=1 Tax=Fusarium solani subsp. cucurbitae TaxID=2747967 RepID=A0ACD3YSZ6_FUSSC|nr:hypothetical protein LCI18_002967 [Fusarium solani-melongenae]
MARIMANGLRIAWAFHNANARLVIATSIFAKAGMLFLFVVNLILLQRVVRAYHPQIGWGKVFGWIFRLLYSSIAVSLIMVIVSVNSGRFNSKAAYYCFNYVIELVVVFTYALSRFDRRCYIPNGSSGPGDYSKGGPGEMLGKQSTGEETVGVGGAAVSSLISTPCPRATRTKSHRREICRHSGKLCRSFFRLENGISK